MLLRTLEDVEEDQRDEYKRSNKLLASLKFWSMPRTTYYITLAISLLMSLHNGSLPKRLAYIPSALIGKMNL